MLNTNYLAGIEYHGVAGSTQDCLAALQRLLLSPAYLERALILTSRHRQQPHHGLLLLTEVGDPIAIKSGFTSGYGGEGPTGFSCALALLSLHGVELEEIDIDHALLERLDASAFTNADMEAIMETSPLRPRELWDYVYPEHYSMIERKNIWRRWDPIIPMQIIDDRLLDLAVAFWTDSDSALLKAHRRLETIVRERIGANGDMDAKGGASRIYALAFQGDAPKLIWEGLGAAERQGRASLFIGAVGAHRNARAHREIEASAGDLLSEFLLINHLYQLERNAVEAPSSADKNDTPIDP